MLTVSLPNFSGGLNLRDSPNELGLNETPASTNWTLDQRGALRVRGGCTQVSTLPGDAGGEATIFFSVALNLWFCIRISGGAGHHHLFKKAADFTGSWTDVGDLFTLTTSAWSSGGCIAMADFPSATPRLICVGMTSGGINGVVTYDGTTLAAATSVNVRGASLAIWQNKGWLTGSSDTATFPHLFYSLAGDVTSWNVSTQAQQVREKDAERNRVLALAGGSLLLFKQRSAYRLTDPATANYVTIDPSTGCLGHRSFTSLRGRVYTWAPDGLYEWDGIGPGKSVGDKARPIFASSTVRSGFPVIAGGPYEERVVFAYPTTNTAAVDADNLIEYSTIDGWLMKHALASSSANGANSFAVKDGVLYAALQDGDAIFSMFTATPGADNGVVFTASYKTPWLQPTAGKLCQIQRARIEGLLLTGGTNTLKFRVYKDWDESSFTEFDISAALRGASSSIDQQESILNSLGHGRAFQFEFVSGTAVGDATVRSLSLEVVELER